MRPTISPPALGTFVERKGKKDQSPSGTEEDKTDSVDLGPPTPGELPPGETLPFVLDAAVVRRGGDREDAQPLGLDVRPEQYHKGGRHNRWHDYLWSYAEKKLAEELARALRDTDRKHSVSPPPTILPKTNNDVSSAVAH